MHESEWADSGKKGGGGGGGEVLGQWRIHAGGHRGQLLPSPRTGEQNICLKLGDLCVFHFSIPIFEWGWGLGGHSENLSTTNI